MKQMLLLVAAVAMLAVAGPAYSQYMFIDVNGDGMWDATNDVLQTSTSSIDVYLVTNENAPGDGSNPAVCTQNASTPLTINSYEFILRVSGSITYGTWADNMGFTINAGDANAGGDFWVARAAAAASAAGKYKLGTLPVSGVGLNSVLSIVTSTTASGVAGTSFGTQCDGDIFDNTYRLGVDWFDVNGTAAPTPNKDTTWGAIKDLYK